MICLIGCQSSNTLSIQEQFLLEGAKNPYQRLSDDSSLGESALTDLVLWRASLIQMRKLLENSSQEFQSSLLKTLLEEQARKQPIIATVFSWEREEAEAIRNDIHAHYQLFAKFFNRSEIQAPTIIINVNSSVHSTKNDCIEAFADYGKVVRDYSCDQIAKIKCNNVVEIDCLKKELFIKQENETHCSVPKEGHETESYEANRWLEEIISQCSTPYRF